MTNLKCWAVPIAPHGSQHLCELEGTRVLCPKKPPTLQPGAGPWMLGGLLRVAAGLLAGDVLGGVKKAKSSFRVLRLPLGYPEPFKNQT